MATEERSGVRRGEGDGAGDGRANDRRTVGVVEAADGARGHDVRDVVHALLLRLRLGPVAHWMEGVVARVN